MLAAKTTLPVIGVPIPTQHLGGLDSLLSIVQMPRGIPVATVAIGNATNAGLLAAAILALSDAALADAWPRGAPARPRPSSTTLRLALAVHPWCHGPADPDVIDQSVDVAVMNSARRWAAELAVAASCGQEIRPSSRLGVEHLDPVAGRRPDVPLDVHPEAVGHARVDDLEDARRSSVAVDDVEREDVVVPALDPPDRGVGHVEHALVGREGEPVRVDEVVADDRQLAACPVERKT